MFCSVFGLEQQHCPSSWMVTVVEGHCSVSSALEGQLTQYCQVAREQCSTLLGSAPVHLCFHNRSPCQNAGELRMWILGLLAFYSMLFPFLISDQSVE